MQQILLHVGVWFLIIIAATLCALVIGRTERAHLALQIIFIRLTDQCIYIMYVYFVWTSRAMNAHEHYQQEVADRTYSAGPL